MKINCEETLRHVIVRLSGSVDMSAGAQFRESPFIGSHSNDLILDLSEVDFMDSAGLAALVLIIRAQKAAGKKCVLASPTPIVAKILKITAIHQLAPIEPSVESAIQLLRGDAL